MNKFDIYYRTAQERLRSQERSAHQDGIRAFQLVTIAGALLIAGLTLLGLSGNFPYEGDTSSVAAVVILVMIFAWILYTVRRAVNAFAGFNQTARQRLWIQGRLPERRGIRAFCLAVLEARRGLTLGEFRRVVTGILIWVIVSAALLVVGYVLLVDSHEDLGDLPIMDVISIGILLAGFFVAAWLGVQAVFFRKLSRGPIPKDLAARVFSLDSNDFCKWVGDLYSEAIEANGEILSERDYLLSWAAFGVGLEVFALAMLGFCNLWGC